MKERFTMDDQLPPEFYKKLKAELEKIRLRNMRHAKAQEMLKAGLKPEDPNFTWEMAKFELRNEHKLDDWFKGLGESPPPDLNNMSMDELWKLAEEQRHKKEEDFKNKKE
jgi:hypothetical protein